MTNEKNVKPEGEQNEKAKKTNIFRKIGSGIHRGFTAVRESPLATVIGAAGGAILTGAGVITATILKSRQGGNIEIEGCDIDDVPEETVDEAE